MGGLFNGWLRLLGDVGVTVRVEMCRIYLGYPFRQYILIANVKLAIMNGRIFEKNMELYHLMISKYYMSANYKHGNIINPLCQ